MYVSIDIETSGLNPKVDEIFEMAAVIWDDNDIMKCSTFHKYVYRSRIGGTPRALLINKKYIEMVELIDPKQLPKGWCWQRDLGSLFKEFLGVEKYFPLGKNYGSFDKQFLERLEGWPGHLLHHRTLDVGSLYATKEGIPSLYEISSPLLFPGEQHTALYDARYALGVAKARLEQ